MITSISLFAVTHVDLEILCENCNEEFVTDSFYVPEPNYSAESSRGSNVMDSEEFSCPNCGEEYNVTIYNSFGGGDVEIDINEENLLKITPYYEEEHDVYLDDEIERILKEKEHFSVFNNGIHDLESITKLEVPENIKRTLIHKAYAGLITQLETYLYGIFVTNILTNKKFFREFVQHYKAFQDQKFNLNEIFKEYDSLETKVRNALSSLMYHNLGKIKLIAIEVFNIDFPEITEIMKIVNTRHDIVHRDSKTKDGKDINLTVQDYIQAQNAISEFVEELENQIHGF